MNQQAILDKMKALDLETYKEIYASLSPEEFAELFYRIGDSLAALSGQTMPASVANAQTELYWMYKQIFDKHITPERRAHVQSVMKQTEDEVKLQHAHETQGGSVQ